jgi:predicted SAM-dependent methyltransferase
MSPIYVPPDEVLAQNAELRDHYNRFVREVARQTHAGHDLRIVFPRKYLRGSGLEIGALHAPVPLPTDARADYVDLHHASVLRARFSEARERYCVFPVIVDDGGSLASLEDGCCDFLVANHVLEHCENFLATLAAHLRVVKTGGYVMYAVPDKNHSFDRDRELTQFDHLLKDLREGPKGQRREHLLDYFTLVGKLSGAALDAAVADYMENGRDIHFHTWTLETFCQHLQQAIELGLITAEIVDFGQNGTEFLVVLGK